MQLQEVPTSKALFNHTNWSWLNEDELEKMHTAIQHFSEYMRTKVILQALDL